MRRNLDDQVADEVDAEVRFHIEARIDELMAEGLDRDEAERRAVAEFGDVEGARRALAREARRTERRARVADWFLEFLQDVRYGWRKLASRPGFAAVAVLTLALGVGANTAIFSVVNAVLLRPLPYPEADRLVRVWEVSPRGDDHNVVSRGNFMDWRDGARSFDALGAYSAPVSVGLAGPEGEPVRVSASVVTPDVFRVLGVSALVGRTFTTGEGVPGSDDVVVLSHRIWRRRFGGDPGAVGSTLTVNDAARTIVGVMPPGFEFPSATVDVWVPWALDEAARGNRRSHNLNVIGRLAPGVDIEEARSEMTAFAARLAQDYPQYMEGWDVNVQPFRADLVRGVRPLLYLLLGVVVIVLLIACANLANLLLARAMAREREVAIRGALGAGRARLIRQFLTEAGLVALLGGALGFALTVGGLDLFVALAPSDIPLLDDTRVDLVVFGFALGVTSLATLLFGLVPALRVTSTNPQTTLRGAGERGGGGRHARLRSGLLVAEVALSAVLLIGAGLLLRSFQQLQRVDYGFDPARLLLTTVNLPSARYGSTPQHIAFFETLTERANGLPGAVSAAGTSDPPGGGLPMTFSFAIEGRPAPGPSGREDPVPLRVVTPGYFQTLRVPLLSGRVLDERDDADAPPVLVINESLARRHWPNSDPVGQRISFQRENLPEWWTIVGVVGDVRVYSADEPGTPALYMSYAQKRWDWLDWMSVVVRTRGEPRGLADELRGAIRSLDPALAVGRIETVRERYAAGESRRRFAAVLLGAFAALALILGTVGVYGVLSYSVAQRTREIGVRIALGARRATVASSVVRQGLNLALAGVAIGLGFAFILSRFLETLVYGITTRDTVTFAAVPLLLVAVAALAAYLPARRATRIDPMRALRTE